MSIFYLDEIISTSLSLHNRELLFLPPYQYSTLMKRFRPREKFIPVITYFLPGYHYSTVMKDLPPPYRFTTAINPFTSIIKSRPWWNTFLTWISIFHLDETFSTKILIHWRDATFSTSTALHNHKETFQTSIRIFYRAISSQPSWFIRTVTDLNVVSLTVSYQFGCVNDFDGGIVHSVFLPPFRNPFPKSTGLLLLPSKPFVSFFQQVV